MNKKTLKEIGLVALGFGLFVLLGAAMPYLATRLTVDDAANYIDTDNGELKFYSKAYASGKTLGDMLASDHAAVSLGTALDTILSLSTQQLDLDTQTANYVLAGPTSGGAAAPAFRALVDADIPSAIARDSELAAVNSITPADGTLAVTGSVTSDYSKTGDNEFLATDIDRHTVTGAEETAGLYTITWSKAAAAKIVSYAGSTNGYALTCGASAANNDLYVYLSGTTLTVANGMYELTENDIITIAIIYEQ